MSVYKNRDEERARIKEITQNIYDELKLKLCYEDLNITRKHLNSIRIIFGITEVIFE